MINTEDKSRNDNDKPFKSRRPAETTPKTHKEITDIVNHKLHSLRHHLLFQGISWAAVRQETHSRKAKVLGAVRMKVLPAFIRLMTKETTESLSRWVPKSLSAISMSSEMCSGDRPF
jgi:hypothetical protein